MTVRKLAWAVAGAALVAVAATWGAGWPGATASATGTAACGAGAPTLTVHGTGTAAGTPDELTVDLVVDASGSSAVGALGADDAASAAVERVLHAGGVADRQVQTTDLTIQPDYSTQGGTTVLTGYSVDDTVVATLTRLSGAGQLLDAVTAAGGDATRIGSLSFGMADPRPLEDRARRDAVVEAAGHAAALAAAAGTHLAGVCSISDQASPVGAPLAAPYGSAGQVAAVPLQVGTEQAEAQVTMVYRLAPGSSG
ncbi:MAG: SIMPL domain-containing protein [Acidimicrobiales bacterium]